ncbi:hypothetical protein A2U01_0038416 [Trifolium medium]|uniref:Uncharacterized protein n=1 Tax=Trifolium medium TaxID=97028 RepID=A0A392Q0A9_9FABA|nr:hypothetical protein [Trifolium medium]
MLCFFIGSFIDDLKLISSVNGDPCGDCPVWGPEDGEFSPVGMKMEEKVSPREVWGWGQDFTLRPAETPSSNTLLK